MSCRAARRDEPRGAESRPSENELSSAFHVEPTEWRGASRPVLPLRARRAAARHLRADGGGQERLGRAGLLGDAALARVGLPRHRGLGRRRRRPLPRAPARFRCQRRQGQHRADQQRPGGRRGHGEPVRLRLSSAYTERKRVCTLTCRERDGSDSTLECRDELGSGRSIDDVYIRVCHVF